jgi:hypothetical protein
VNGTTLTFVTGTAGANQISTSGTVGDLLAAIDTASQALSTRQSIAVSALALANQSQQSVLQLLR